MNIFTKNKFENAVNSLSRQRMTFSNILNETRSYANARYGQKTIFLSHSHHDARYVNMTRAFFERLGINLYVDWADESMPTYTCGYTALKIKEKIRENDFFILLATDLALWSKWCNWELGIGDTYKCVSDRLAILPWQMILIIGEVMSIFRLILISKDLILLFGMIRHQNI